MHNILSKPTIMYGSEIWVLGAQHQKSIEVAQMRSRGQQWELC